MERCRDSSDTRTALFGGTFDPVHTGHIEIARAAADRFNLKKVLFVPAAIPPHKPGGAFAPYEDRYQMVKLSCAADPRFEASRVEADSVRSYSILTIERLCAAGDDRLSFLIGADAFAEIRSWHRWRDVVKSVEFIVVKRPGADWDRPPGAIVHELTGLNLPVSSSEIRAQLMRGSVDVPVPKAVLEYIHSHSLYQSRHGQNL